MRLPKEIIHEEYRFDANKGIQKKIDEWQKAGLNEIRLDIIMELCCTDHPAWWLIGIGTKVLKERMKKGE